MYNSNLAYKINDVKVPEWDYFVNEIAIVFKRLAFISTFQG